MDKSPLITGRQTELTDAQKMDLIVLSANPTFEVVYLLWENLILDARDEAMAVDPSEPAKQASRMTEAHALAKAYKRFRDNVTNSLAEQHGKIKLKVAETLAKEQDFIDQIVLSQASGNIENLQG